MCGIVAICDDRLFGGEAIVLMTNAMRSIKHRGYRSLIKSHNHFVLGHTRLAIQGLGEEFDQPVIGDLDFLGAYVGEIFNAKKYALGQKSDVPLMMEALATPDGDYQMQKFDGFWATVHQSLYSPVEARVDHLAIKQLYLHEKLGVIASELRAIECFDNNLKPDMLYRANVIK
jgi:asparagine synthetase B (glutamine-hydrolysing)